MAVLGSFLVFVLFLTWMSTCTQGMPTPSTYPTFTTEASTTNAATTTSVYLTQIVTELTQVFQTDIYSTENPENTSLFPTKTGNELQTSKSSTRIGGISSEPVLTNVPQPTIPQIEISESIVIITLKDLSPSVSNVYVAVGHSSSTTRSRRQPTNISEDPNSYLVANLTRYEVKTEAANFTLGDGKTYGGYLNTPLEDGAMYSVSVAHANCVMKVCVVAWSNPVSFTAPNAKATKDTSIAAIVLGVLFGIFAVFQAIIIALLLWRKRRLRQKQPSEDPTPTAQVNKGFSNEDEFEEIEMNEVLYADIKSFKWNIYWSDLKLTNRVLGKGHFGNVRLGGVRIQDKWIKSAVKILNSDTADYDNIKTELHEEFKAMTRIDLHTNVINVLGICEHKGTVYAALEYAPHGSLRRYLRESRKDSSTNKTGSYQTLASQTLMSTLNSEQLLNIAIGVAKGMEHLATCRIIHRDLSARNILIGKNITPKVTNFAKPHGKVTKEFQRNPLRWLAIESLAMRIYTSKSDAWSFGILMWEIATLGGTPYPEMESKFLNFHLNNGYRLPKPENCDTEIYELMKRCWKEKADMRPSFAEIVETLEHMASQQKMFISTSYKSVGLQVNNNVGRESLGISRVNNKKGKSTLGITTFVPIRPERDDN